MTATGHIGVLAPRDLPSQMLVPYARYAEHAGFDELWVVEDLGFRGGVAQAATVLATTESIQVGIGIMPVGARNAVYAAMELATLAEQFPGRLVAGLGHGMPGWMRRAGAWPASPLTLLEEYFAAVAALLRGEPAPPDGHYVKAGGVRLEFTPDLVPPLLAGVRGERSLELAGHVADGVVLAEPATPEYVRAALTHVGGAPRVVAYNIGSVGRDQQLSRAAAREALAWVGEPDWRPHIEPLDFSEEFYDLRIKADSPQDFARSLPDAFVDRLAVVGSPERARGQLVAMFDAGVTSAVLIPSGDEPLDALHELSLVTRA